MVATFRALDQRQRWLYWSCFALGLLWLLSLLARATGTPLDDEIAHVVIARSIWQHPEVALNIWGRVANTLIYAVPSLVGLTGARLASVTMAVLTVLVTTAVAQRLGVKRLYLVALMLWFQPWFNDLSYAAITEVPFSLVMILGMYWWLEGRYEQAAVAFSVLSLIRHEGIAFFGLWVLYMLVTRRWKAALVGWLPIALYNLVYGLALHVPLSELPFAIYFRPNAGTFYGSGSLLNYIPAVIVGVGFAELVWGIYGVLPAIRLGRRAWIFFPFLLYFVIQSVIFWLGLFGSGGYGLFLLPMAPGFALLAALGAEHVLDGLMKAARQNRAQTRQIVIRLWALVVVVPVLFFGLRTRPYEASSILHALSDAAAWLKANPPTTGQVYSSHPWFNYADDLPATQSISYDNLVQPDQIHSGDVFVWDDYYSERLGYTYAVMTDPANHWTVLHTFGNREAVIFQKQ